MFDPDQWLEIGKIVAPQGLRGELRVYPSTDFPERFLEPGERWLLRKGNADVEPVRLVGGRFLEGKGLYVIQLQGITSREQADELRNARLWVPEGDRPTLNEGEYHVADLIGLMAYHQATGEHIGTVKDIFPAGNDLLEVELVAGDRSTDAVPNASAELPMLQDEGNGNSTIQDEGDAHSSIRKSARKKKRKRSRPAPSPMSKTVLIPFVYDIVPVVDLTNQRIEILPPRGLLESSPGHSSTQPDGSSHKA
jgi:16S rRNA processing protein RimM